MNIVSCNEACRCHHLKETKKIEITHSSKSTMFHIVRIFSVYYLHAFVKCIMSNLHLPLFSTNNSGSKEIKMLIIYLILPTNIINTRNNFVEILSMTKQ